VQDVRDLRDLRDLRDVRDVRDVRSARACAGEKFAVAFRRRCVAALYMNHDNCRQPERVEEGHSQRRNHK
jgi:hypothetical protein